MSYPQGMQTCKWRDIASLINVNPIDYSFGYDSVLGLKHSVVKYVCVDEISTISEQMWNTIAHVTELFGFIFCGFGDSKQLKPVNEEHLDFLDSWIVKYISDNTFCGLEEAHRFNEGNSLQDAYTCMC